MAATQASHDNLQETGAGKRYTAKDFILIAVFGALVFFITMAFSIVFSFNVNLAFWTHAVAGIVAGVVWTYLMARVPKTGVAAMAGAIVALFGFLMGMFWSGPVGILVGGVAAELVMAAGKRSAMSLVIGFGLFMACWWVGQMSLIFFGAEAYVQMCVDAGLTAEYGQGLVDWGHSPAAAAAGVCTFITGCLGAFIGTRIFKKHFAKITG